MSVTESMSKIPADVFEKEYLHDGFPVLSVHIEIPIFSIIDSSDNALPRAAKRMNKLYKGMRDRLIKEAERTLLPCAGADYEAKLATGRFCQHKFSHTSLPEMQYDTADAEDDSEPQKGKTKLIVRRTINVRNGNDEGKEYYFSDSWDENGWLILSKKRSGLRADRRKPAVGHSHQD